MLWNLLRAWSGSGQEPANCCRVGRNVFRHLQAPGRVLKIVTHELAGLFLCDYLKPEDRELTAFFSAVLGFSLQVSHLETA